MFVIRDFIPLFCIQPPLCVSMLFRILLHFVICGKLIILCSLIEYGLCSMLADR